MPPPRWFAVGSADGAEPDAGVRTANEALMYDDAKLLLRTAVVAAGIASNAPLGIGVRHPWRRVGEPMLVTRSGGKPCGFHNQTLVVLSIS